MAPHIVFDQPQTARSNNITIIKIGGSLLAAPELKQWLDVVVQHSDGLVIIVPGGAIFADAVREAQRLTNMHDQVAHHLALLAMDQFGLMMLGMNPGLVAASSELEIAECGWQHRGIVWLPSKMLLADESIPQNWQVTSDSLSAWLANKLKAKCLMVVKSASLDAYRTKAKISAQMLVDDGLLDAQFPAFLSGQSYQTWVVNKSEVLVFGQGFNEKAFGRLKKQALLLQS